MKLEYYGVSKENLKSGLNMSITDSTRARYIKNIETKKVSDMLDWLDLPDMSEEEITRIESVASLSKKMTDFVVLGIGGSALGVRFLKDAIVDSIHKDVPTNVHVCDNIDPDKFLSLLDTLNLKKTMFNVITKSGSTSETLTQLLLVMDSLKAKKIDISKHIVVTTTKGNSLWQWAETLGIETLDIAKGVGGRFSVLSAVGLLPACVMGLNIREMLNGAKDARTLAFENSDKNIAYTCAYINYNYLKKGYTNLVTMPYSDRLALMPEFFAQLWAESLGKRVNRKGEEVFAGQTPIKTLGVTDQHSQLQLYSEGPKDKLIMFLRVASTTQDRLVESSLPFAPHLQNISLKTLLDYEYTSTAYSLTSIDRPNYTLVLDEVNENTLGNLIFMLEMMTAFMGEMLDINTYDQPGVELSKLYTKAMLGVKSEQSRAKEIKTYMKDNKKFTL